MDFFSRSSHGIFWVVGFLLALEKTFSSDLQMNAIHFLFFLSNKESISYFYVKVFKFSQFRAIDSLTQTSEIFSMIFSSPYFRSLSWCRLLSDCLLVVRSPRVLGPHV